MFRFIVLIILGLLVVALPYVSFPPAVEALAQVVIGLMIVLLSSYCLNMARRHMKKHFGGANPDTLDTPEVDTLGEVISELSARVDEAFNGTSKTK